jgi:hypothetical protein
MGLPRTQDRSFPRNQSDRENASGHLKNRLIGTA